MADFFVSYTKSDQTWAEWIASTLEANGYSCVIQAWDFRPGANFVIEMQEAVKNAQRTLAVVSPAYLHATYTAAEWASTFADDPKGLEHKLVPVRIAECRPEGLLKTVVYIDLVGLNELAARAALLSGLGTGRAKPLKPPGFPGLSLPPKFPGGGKQEAESRPQVIGVKPVEPKRILVVCANPRGTDPLRLAEEERVLKESIQLSPNRDKLDVTVLNAATIDDLRRRLLGASYDVVHFSGHGTRAGLVFEDNSGRLMVPDSASLGALLQRRGVSTAVLNACYSLSAGSFSALGTDFTIAMDGPIADAAAIEFTRGFYDALGAGLDIPDAYTEGLAAANLKHLTLSAILLRRGENTTPVDLEPSPDLAKRELSSKPIEDPCHLLLGIALDTSGTMESSIRNDQRGSVSRLSSVKDSVHRLAREIRREIQSAKSEVRTANICRIFVYAFGLRHGDVVDLLSVIRAADTIDIRQEVELGRKRLEAEARQKYSGMSGIPDIARRYGFGDLVDNVARSVRAAAERSGRDQIASEISALLLSKAKSLGDSTVTPSELADLLDRPSKEDILTDIEPLIYGMTPMRAAVEQIRRRFEQTTRPESVKEERVLLIVSDGDSTDGNPLEAFVSVRQLGVTIVACYVTDADIANPRLLLASPDGGWSEGARVMFEAASLIDDNGPLAKDLLRRGWAIEPRAHLFVQVNHSDVLDEFVSVVASPLGITDAVLLPKGR